MLTTTSSGLRAGRLVERLAALGYDAVNVGGYRDWVAAGLPTRIPEDG